MKYLLPFILAIVLCTSCSKNKKFCWRCNFSIPSGTNALDTTVCGMTSDESKNFQQAQVKKLTDFYGVPQNQPIGSACYKQNNK